MQQQSGSLRSISDSKLISFAVGTQKKSRFQREKEEKDLKKKQEEAEAARIYGEFVASFQEPSKEVKFVKSDSNEIYNDMVISGSKKRGSEIDALIAESMVR